MAKTIDGVIGFVGTEASNYIKQINDGTTTHDIAVKSGITFFNGANDENGLTWDGKQPLEVVIPTLADIVSNPVIFAGTVGTNGTISWASGKGPDPQTGYLVYITDDCTFAGEACEAGDMAVYDGTAWRVIQGENQVSLAGGTVDASGNHVVLTDSATKVIDVEGKELTLAVDYSDILGKISATGNAAVEIALSNGQTVISGKYLSLSKTKGTASDITTAVSIDLPTALADGAVTISDKVLVSGDFTFTSGSFPTISKNAAAIAVNASHNMTIVASGTGDFVTGVTAIKAAALEDGDATTNDIAYVAGLSAISGKSFISGIHAHTTTDGDTPADFTVPGVVTADVSANTFATGWGAEAASGEVVSSIAVGAVTGEFVSGLSGNGTSVLTSVTFGDTEQDSTRGWFVTGLADDAVAVTAVSFGEVVVTPSTSNAMVSASVNASHVLVFNTGSFVTSASASLSGTGVTTKAFTKGGVKLTGFSSASDTLTKASVTQAETTISYKSLSTGAVTLSQDTTGFHFDKAEGAAYSAVMSYKKVTVTTADVVKAGAALDNVAITANIPADTVAVGLNAGTLPSLAIAAPTGTIAGTVGTALTTSSVSWLGVDPAKKNIAGVDTWSLVEAAEGIEVAVAGTYDVSGTTEISANEFVGQVLVSGTSIVTPANNG